MALYMISRQCTKLGNVPRFARQLKTFNKSIYIPNMVLGIKNTLKNEVQIVRKISLTAPKLSSHGNHSTIWYAEKVLSLGLLLLLPAAIAAPCQALDYTLAVAMVLHVHWGLEAIVTDYVRPILFGNTVPKVAHGLTLLLSIVTLAGLINFIYNDIGIGEAVRKLWAIKAAELREE